MNTTKYVVLNEHTLCYRQDGSQFLGVLHGSVLRGGHDWKNGSVAVSPRCTVRPATTADFEEYRCMLPPDHPEHPGHAEYMAKQVA